MSVTSMPLIIVSIVLRWQASSVPINSKPEWEETPEGSEVVRVLLIPHMRGITTPTVYRGITRRNLELPRYGFEPVIWSG